MHTTLLRLRKFVVNHPTHLFHVAFSDLLVMRSSRLFLIGLPYFSMHSCRMLWIKCLHLAMLKYMIVGNLLQIDG